MKRFKYTDRGRLRRGAVAVQVGVMSTVILGMGALAIDVGSMYVTQTELQAAADSAALAAAQRLMGDDSGVAPSVVAEQTAAEYAAMHHVAGHSALLDTSSDVELGRAELNHSTGRWEFVASNGNFDSVRVTVRKSAGSPNGALPLTFAHIFGVGQTDLWADSTAMLIPRDIAVVIDLSGSMGYDSMTTDWNRNDGGYSNARDIWAALNGPEPDRPYEPGSELETQYASDTGPTWGLLNNWGNALLPGSYSPGSDPGLIFIQKTKNVSGTALTTLTSSLTSRGYNTAERNALLNAATTGNDGTSAYWRNRCGVCMGLATWRSGKAGSVMGSGGDGDNYVEDSEVTWVAAPSFASGWTWKDYIDYPQGSQYSTGSGGFKYRYGLKTFVDFLIDSKPTYAQTNKLWATPEQPLRAVKDAVQTLTNTIEALDSPDHMALETFGTTAVHELNLTEDIQSIPTRLYQRQSAHFNGTTNIGAGLVKAINELKSSRARDSAKKVIVLMSDGIPNVGENGVSGTSAGQAYALAAAQLAADEHFVVYAVSVGFDADRPLMQAIAEITHGQEFYAAGAPEEYTEELERIFRSLGGKRPVALIE